LRSEVKSVGTTAAEQRAAFAKMSAAQAATEAGNQFAGRYDGQLEPSDVVAIAQAAGASGLAGRLATDERGRPLEGPALASAYVQALETTLWTTPAFRSKVLTETTPTTVPAVDEASSKDRKRKLSAVSSAASPVTAEPTPRRSPLETRPDGRLTPQSRMNAVKEIVTQLNRSQNEGTS
jgi:hypothetical protein